MTKVELASIADADGHTALEPTRDPFLENTVQPLGILPTPWFWRSRANFRHVGWIFVLLGLVTGVGGAVLGIHPGIGFAVWTLTFVGGLGCVERFVRRSIKRRRESLAEPRSRKS